MVNDIGMQKNVQQANKHARIHTEVCNASEQTLIVVFNLIRVSSQMEYLVLLPLFWNGHICQLQIGNIYIEPHSDSLRPLPNDAFTVHIIYYIYYAKAFQCFSPYICVFGVSSHPVNISASNSISKQLFLKPICFALLLYCYVTVAVI